MSMNEPEDSRTLHNLMHQHKLHLFAIHQETDYNENEYITEEETDPLNICVKNQQLEDLAESLLALPAVHRDIVTQLFGLDDQDPKVLVAIAEKYGCTHQNIRSKYVLALKRLKAAMQQRGHKGVDS